MRVNIRPARRDDLPTLYDVCYLTSADGGAPEASCDTDRSLVGHHYVGPYLALEPDLCFVAEDDLGAAGYIVGTADTAAFERRAETEWYPELRMRYPAGTGEGLDAILIALLHQPVRTEPEVAASHPAHLHIDLLPRLQGSGVGRRLMHTMHDACRQAGAPAIHLRVSRGNTGAVGFYGHLGYELLREDPYSLTLGHQLDT